jgi:exosortase C (VPDSG-CTERM-specific)
MGDKRSGALPGELWRRERLFAVWVVVLCGVLAVPLVDLVRYASANDLHSHVVLVPIVFVGLLFLRRGSTPWGGRQDVAGVCLAGGLAAGCYAAGWMGRADISHGDYLAWMACSFVLAVIAGGFWCLGRIGMKKLAFPFGFLFFMVPLPDVAVSALEHASMLASAEAADWWFGLVGMPVLREGVVFHIPGIVLEVADECSGIRSSWVLLITAVLASNLFLASAWRRWVLISLVIPLGILRNGFRIMVIGFLCAEYGAEMIDSFVHRRGGPLFFGISLVVLFALLWMFRAWEEHAIPRNEMRK